MNIRILIVDDHLVVRVGTVTILRSAYPDVIIDQAKTYDEMIDLLKMHQYALVMLDINMPGTQYTQMVLDIKALQDDVKIMVFSTYEETVALQYIRKGAEGYLNKQCSEEDIKEAVNIILKTGFYYPPGLIPMIMRDIKDTAGVKNLTAREYQVFELLAKGNGNLEISNYLDVQVSTISTFKKRIFEKLKVNNIAELIEVYKSLH